MADTIGTTADGGQIFGVDCCAPLAAVFTELSLKLGQFGAAAATFLWGSWWRRLNEAWSVTTDTAAGRIVGYLSVAQIALLRGSVARWFT